MFKKIKSVLNSKLNRLNLFYLKKTNSNLIIGENCRIDWNCYIDLYGNSCVIGKNVTLQSQQKNYHAGIPFPTSILIDVKNACVVIGDNTCIHGTYIHAQKKISIGSGCAIAAGVNIIDSNGHLLNSKVKNGVRDTPEEIIIGDNVWIGLNSIILKGSVIGNNCVVSAQSVVKGVFENDCFIAGNPAKVVKKINF